MLHRRRPARESARFGTRAAALVLAILLSAGSLDAGFTHACPHHAALPGGHTTAESDAHARATAAGESDASRAQHESHTNPAGGAPGTARERAHGPAHASTHGSAHGNEGPDGSSPHGPCTCIGTCQAGGGMPLAVGDVARIVLTAEVAEITRVPAAAATPTARVAYLFPYSTAPPRSADSV